MEGDEQQKAAGVSEKSTAVVKSEPEEDDDASGHVCRVCGRSFPLLSSLSQHMRRHTREKPYKCPYCEHRTAQKGSLKAHIRSHKLGLLSPGSAAGEGDGELVQKDDTEACDDGSGGAESMSDEGRRVNGKVTRKAPSRKKITSGDVEAAADQASPQEPKEESKSGPFPCSQCSQVFPKALLLKAHMKRHRGAQDHGCRICGRRFRQAWFLQSHMRIHKAKSKAQLRSSKDGGLPATINGVPQDPASLTNEDCVYELCAGCGNFFHDRKALRLHERSHKQINNGRPALQSLPPPQHDSDDKAELDKTRFLECLNLMRVTTSDGESPVEERASQGGRIPQLDPVCSYQAWQLVTRGRVAEVTEKYLGWEERLADAEVAYDRDKGEYVPLKQERKRKQSDAAAAPSCNVKKKKSGGGGVATAATVHDGTSTNSLTHKIGAGGGGGGSRKILNRSSDRILFNGLGHAFYGALQKQAVKEGSSAVAKPANNIRNHAKEDGKKPCEHCDFRAADASSLWSHMHSQHQDILLAPRSKQQQHTAILDNLSQTNSKASYMDYLRNRSALLSQTHSSPYATGPAAAGQERLAANIRTEKSKGDTAAVDAANLLNLSALSEGQGEGAAVAGDHPVKSTGLVRHQCPYCSHTTTYPEVLWVHQRVAHKVDGTSSLAPKWAPSANFRGSRTSGAPWRRTGAPPFLEGKDCPALPAPKSQRTQPPCSSPHNSSSSAGGGSSSGSKRPATKTHTGASTNKSKLATQSKDPQSSVDGASLSSGRTATLPQKKKYAEQPPRATDTVGSKGTTNHVHHQVTSSSSSSSSRSAHHGKSALPNTQSASSSPKHRGGNRVAAVEGNLVPQEGLGFMLARNYGRTPFHGTADRSHRHHPHGQARDSSSAVAKGHDVWSAMSMWGMHAGGRAYLDPLLFAQGKSESAGDMPMDIDILSLLKNYSPHDLAALYQHWGFVDPRFDPQAMLQLNGNFGSEVHASSEASKQVDSHSTSSSGSLQKGM